jgi:hypothetical protein
MFYELPFVYSFHAFPCFYLAAALAFLLILEAAFNCYILGVSISGSYPNILISSKFITLVPVLMLDSEMSNDVIDRV